MIFENPEALLERICEVLGRKIRKVPEVLEDTTSYMNIISGCVLRLGNEDYYIITDAREGRFGLDDQPKFWVKYAYDLTTGEKKIIKLVFHEEFTIPFGPIKIRRVRSSKKESDILDWTKGHPRFMQGKTVVDPAGNLVRIIDIIPGPSLYKHITRIKTPHEEYFFEQMPTVMKQVISCIEAMAELHKNGHHHGDVRNDHILINSKTGIYAWIDFDYGANYSDYDIWCMGNILSNVIGKGIHRRRNLSKYPEDYPHFKGTIDDEDMGILLGDRIANIGKLFPYIPKEINDILLRFSAGTTNFYSDFQSQIDDLKRAFN